LNVRDLAATLENRKQFVLGSKLGWDFHDFSLALQAKYKGNT
jgi:hypothetical protein